MRFVVFTHSLVSDWNHGNAHFLRGIAAELQQRGHSVCIFEPEDGWSRRNLLEEGGQDAICAFHRFYPDLRSSLYRHGDIDLDAALAGADVVLVHEWNDPELVASLGRHRARGGDYQLFFHDTHHRSVTDVESMSALDLAHYDGVLAYGELIRQHYLRNCWARSVWTWHEAADTGVFHPRDEVEKDGDLVWIGNWGDGERTEELREFLIEPVRKLKLKARVYGVRYPAEAIDELADSGIDYGGWLPNYRVPEVFARYRLTVHIPRRPYREILHGIPTIRPFEALACGIPMISAPWRDDEGLFHVGRDFLIAQDGEEMCTLLRALLSSPELAGSFAACGLATIRGRHTCAHRVDQLLAIVEESKPALAGQSV